jgi:hypothetical protein
MKLKLSAVALLAMFMPMQTRAAPLTDAEAIFLDQLVTAGAVLSQQCPNYEVDGGGMVQRGARLLGSPDAAMAMIAAVDAAIKVHDGEPTTQLSSARKYWRRPEKRPTECWRS